MSIGFATGRRPVGLVGRLAVGVLLLGPASAAIALLPGGPARAQVAAPPEPLQPAAPQRLSPDQINLLMQTLADVESEGFRRQEFTPPDMEELLRSQAPEDRDRGEALLRTAILSYAKAQHGARLPLSAFDKNWGMRPAPFDAEAEYEAALSQDRLSDWLTGLAPPFDRYHGLKEALAQYRNMASQGGWSALDFATPVGPSSSGAKVVSLRRRLAAEDSQGGLDVSSPSFDAALTAAVQRFQHNVGLVQTGVVDKNTLKALNVTVQSRIEQIEANMERWRWVTRVWPATRIEANIAAEEMDAFQDNGLVLEMRAAPGRPDDQTPLLSSQVESVVFDPPWNVPSSIATKELWPKEAAHPGYLASHGYRVISTGEDGGRRIQQKFGPKSALGKMKFDFPNTYSVYLHDTPSRAAFGRTSRAVSHGCVRLQRPLELANLLFQSNADWPPDRIDDVVAAGSTVRAPLSRPMPIYLMYWTAFLDVKGRVNFRPDVYGWDQELMGLIAAASK